ncbi:MAG: glycine oxidase ThiO [Pyrinomonadaceae bacterium]|nr:glycine oxidase ThiO [Pyrinomonadaceae bacterium]
MKVLIVGGGIAGLTIAREFQKRHENDVTVLDRNLAGREASFAAAGMLAPQAECDSADALFRFCSASRDFYPGFTDELRDETGIDVGLDREGTLAVAFDEADEEELKDRYRWQVEAGLEVERLSARETHKLEPFISPDSIGSLFFPKDWQVENRALMGALRTSFEQRGGTLVEHEEIKSVANDGKTSLMAGTGVYEGDVIVFATGAWTSLIEADRVEFEMPLVKPVKGQMISYRTAKRLISKVIYGAGGYLVPRNDGRVLVGATVEDAGFDKTVTDEGRESLRESALRVVPSLQNLRIDENWSGLRPISGDGNPLIGALNEELNIYISGGHYRNGILLAPLSARILVDHILEDTRSEFLADFSPARFVTATAS